MRLGWAKEQVRLMNEAEKEDAATFTIDLNSGTDPIKDVKRHSAIHCIPDDALVEEVNLRYTITASGGCERARKEISRFAARARRGVNVQNENRLDVYDRTVRQKRKLIGSERLVVGWTPRRICFVI